MTSPAGLALAAPLPSSDLLRNPPGPWIIPKIVGREGQDFPFAVLLNLLANIGSFVIFSSAKVRLCLAVVRCCWERS